MKRLVWKTATIVIDLTIPNSEVKRTFKRISHDLRSIPYEFVMSPVEPRQLANVTPEEVERAKPAAQAKADPIHYVLRSEVEFQEYIRRQQDKVK